MCTCYADAVGNALLLLAGFHIAAAFGECLFDLVSHG
jgi:hypothetical protein